MLPLADFVRENQELCKQLHRFSRPKATRLIAALGVLPQYHANTIRIELLTHLAIIACAKDAEPQQKDLQKWLHHLGRDAWISRQEDPVEDVFVGSVNSNLGTLRLFNGIFADGYFITERLVTFLTNGISFPTFQETLDIALTLLRLSDVLADRLGLQRNTPGGGQSAGKIAAPRWRELKPAFDALFFSERDLERLDISAVLLNQFCFTDDDAARLPSERLWNSSLERRPLLPVDGGIIVAEPSTISRAVVRWILERIRLTQMGGWADTFFQQENASLFVNDVANDLDIRSLNVALPPPPDDLPLLMPFVGSFDVGKPVVMLTYAASVVAGADEFDGFDEFNEKEQEALDSYLPTLANALEKLPNFSGGLILVAIVSIGRGNVFRITPWSERWHSHVAPLHDWLTLAADPDCSALRMWKLAEHVSRARQRYNTELLNPSGLIALWSFWKKSEFWLLPKEFDIRNPRNLLVIGTDFGVDPRLEAKLAQDIHSIRSHDGTKWTTVQRLNPASLFPQDEKSRVYADRIAARERRLVGYVETDNIRWWLIAPRVEAPRSHLDVLFQLWECVLHWIDRSSDLIHEELSPRMASIEVNLELPDFARWKFDERRVQNKRAVTPYVDVRPSRSSITVTLYEKFLLEFNQPKNTAERAIVGALIEGMERLCEVSLTGDKRQEIVSTIVGSDDARYFHFLETHMLEHMVGATLRAHPTFVGDEDLAFVQIGLADLAGRPTSEPILEGKTECQRFLQMIVERIWERIESQLKQFSRQSIATTCFAAIDEISRDSEHWTITARSILALDEKKKSAKNVLKTRRSQRSIASVANRVLIETAQYAASDHSGNRLNAADHAQLLALVELLITMAQHRDAVAYDFIEPKLEIHPRGDVEVSHAFYKNVMQKYLSHRSDKLTDKAVKSYDSYFDSGETSEPIPPENEIREFDIAFEAEFGFSAEQLVRLSELWARFAIDSRRLAGVIQEPEMERLLAEHAEMTPLQMERFLDVFTLPIRSAWDADLPLRCSKQDVFPWRFRRNLSLLMRPLVLVNAKPKAWLISAPLFKKAAQYLTGNLYEGRLPDRFFTSKELRYYIGAVVDRHGHAFAERVASVFAEHNYKTRLEVKLTGLGAAKNPDLGDVDVLAWMESTKNVFIVECKRLTPALTVKEVIQRLEEFRGDEKRKDSLRKHLNRTSWLTKNPAGIHRITGIPAADIVFRSLLVTSETVPMQFFSEMNFPTKQVVAIDDLGSVLSKRR